MLSGSNPSCSAETKDSSPKDSDSSLSLVDGRVMSLSRGVTFCVPGAFSGDKNPFAGSVPSPSLGVAGRGTVIRSSSSAQKLSPSFAAAEETTRASRVSRLESYATRLCRPDPTTVCPYTVVLSKQTPNRTARSTPSTIPGNAQTVRARDCFSSGTALLFFPSTVSNAFPNADETSLEASASRDPNTAATASKSPDPGSVMTGFEFSGVNVSSDERVPSSSAATFRNLEIAVAAHAWMVRLSFAGVGVFGVVGAAPASARSLPAVPFQQSSSPSPSQTHCTSNFGSPLRRRTAMEVVLPPLLEVEVVLPVEVSSPLASSTATEIAETIAAASRRASRPRDARFCCGSKKGNPLSVSPPPQSSSRPPADRCRTTVPKDSPPLSSSLAPPPPVKEPRANSGKCEPEPQFSSSPDCARDRRRSANRIPLPTLPGTPPPPTLVNPLAPTPEKSPHESYPAMGVCASPTSSSEAPSISTKSRDALPLRFMSDTKTRARRWPISVRVFPPFSGTFSVSQGTVGPPRFSNPNANACTCSGVVLPVLQRFSVSTEQLVSP
mmetsp:Transcript_8188/g.27213  ORF Transcript_8188/g.27213 Transcript_8188/m.27213 type:complete len:552 (-) Transcript_8188:899-2554(-)